MTEVSHTPSATYRLFVNSDRTVYVRLWPDGSVEVATRPEPDRIWGPPITVRETEA